MPKREVMAQLSRPYQVALATVALLVLLWFAVLRGHSSPAAGGAASAGAPTPSQSASSTSSAASGVASSAATAAAQAKRAATPTPEYHGSLPGMKGLSRAISRAHEAVGTSQREAAAIESAAAQSSTAAGAGGASTATTDATQTQGGAHSPTSTSGSGVQAHSPAGSRSRAGGRSSSTSTHKRLSRPAEIARELHHGKVVLLLFWNPQSADDVSVHNQLGAVSHSLKSKVVVHYAHAREVGSFGTVTRNISVYQTPTLLVIGRHRLVTTITGLTDAFAIEQAVREANG